MKPQSGFHVVTVGWPKKLIDELCADIAAQSDARFSHIAHPRHTARDWAGRSAPDNLRFFREPSGFELPAADTEFLASLEQPGVPTVHNMILGDRIVSRLPHADALRYATFVGRRQIELLGELQPSVVIGGFDALHGGLALAVARRMGVPWFALHFSVLPPGFACFCDRMSPAARVQLAARPGGELLRLAEASLRQFEERRLQAYAYSPPPQSIARAIARIPGRLDSARRILRKGRDREFARFAEVEPRYNMGAAVRQLWRTRRARRAIETVQASAKPPDEPYVLFGLHMQPESSIDVWAPYFSNQPWVIELISRSIPPTHRLLVKIHKSDVARWSSAALARMGSLPGVELVHPSADARNFVEKAALVVGIQGTMGLEAALLGRPVIMLGESPLTVFPNAKAIGALPDLPALVKAMLTQAVPRHDEIVEGYASYLAPFLPAGHNDWRTRKTADEVQGFVRLFDLLQLYVDGKPGTSARLAT